MSLLSNLLGVNPQPNQNGSGMFGGIGNLVSMVQKFQQFKTNPVGALLQMNPNLNIPQNIANNPQAVVNHLLSTGQMSPQTYEQLTTTANQFQSMIPKF